MHRPLSSPPKPCASRHSHVAALRALAICVCGLIGKETQAQSIITVTGMNPAGTVTGSYGDVSSFMHGFVRSVDGTITTFDVPVGIQTRPLGINPAGAVTGFYFDASSNDHGFVRSADGTIITFDVPGALKTRALDINPAGTIAGRYFDAGGYFHGFVRTADGTIITFDGPDALQTRALDINPAGTVTGYYEDADRAHGFMRARDGTITSFDVSGAIRTYAYGINPAGTITGQYVEANGSFHGFVRSPDGTITMFDVPGAIQTFAQSINPAGTVTGSYWDRNSYTHGFVRTAHGTVTTFDGPGAFNTQAYDINPAGTVSGIYTTAGADHGFVRTADGTITTFDAPGALNSAVHRPLLGRSGTGFDLLGLRVSVFPTDINPARTVTGSCYEAGLPGFLRAVNDTVDGRIDTFDVPDATSTEGVAIDPSGVVTGDYIDTNGHGFVRAADGTITTVDVPGAESTVGGVAINPLTWPLAINTRGQIVGLCGDPPAWRYCLWDNGAVSDLGITLPGPGFDYAASINERGQVVVASWCENRVRPVLWDRGAVTILDGTCRLEGRHPIINARGQILYNYYGYPDGGHAVLYDNGTATDLDRLDGLDVDADGTIDFPSTWIEGMDLNDKGQVVGWIGYGTADDPAPEAGQQAFIWEHGVTRRLEGIDGGYAFAINNQGQVLVGGLSRPPAGVGLWQNGALTDLGITFTYPSNRRLNERGQVVGDVFTTPDFSRTHAVVWQRGVVTDLGTLEGDVSSHATHINDRGDILGWSTGPQGTRAVVWREGRITDLGTLGGSITEAFDMNERGQVIGRSQTANGEFHAFLWERDKMIDLTLAEVPLFR